MKKLFIVFALFFLIGTAVSAQDYNTGIGVRGGLWNGLTVKHFIGNNTAIEGLLTSRWEGFNITGLYQIHAWRAFDVPRLNWYYGAGAHLGFWEGHARHPWFSNGQTYTVLGVDGILGLEYNIEQIPFNISLDWKPIFNILGHTGFWGDEFALSVRYIF
jgi:hypothetical protein